MSQIVANRYARALFEVAEERDAIDSIEAQLTSVSQILAGNEDLRRVLRHPRVSREKKKELIGKLFADDIGAEVMNLLKLLIDHKRESIIDTVLEAYTRLADVQRGILDITVTTARPLSDEQEQDLSGRLSATLGKKLRMHLKVKEEIIGGILLRIGDRVYDGTIAGRLADFKQEIKVGKQG
ncbi:MAG: F0F1 ATP synthase subunit delta [Sporolactobacillus sp.]|jgi:F-type H+-transporting ATPase subunit delta|nr:F0F1 ATP synthase subunit delta [Sporolactobacillus sp.]MCI1881133.1 F0F1 ATP synthase subunit delta [Sporolactobacillus sp.]